MADLDAIAAENAAKSATRVEENVRKGNAKIEALEKTARASTVPDKPKG